MPECKNPGQLGGTLRGTHGVPPNGTAPAILAVVGAAVVGVHVGAAVGAERPDGNDVNELLGMPMPVCVCVLCMSASVHESLHSWSCTPTWAYVCVCVDVSVGVLLHACKRVCFRVRAPVGARARA